MTILVAALALVVVAMGVAPSAWAQAGFYVTPSFAIAEEYDDNVFVSSVSPQSDFITRFTPGIALGYRSEPFTLLVSSSIDAEIYAENTELSNVANRKRAALDLKYLPYRLLTLGLDVKYFETNTPGELVPTTGLQLTRTQGTELDVTPSATYQITAVDTARSSYEFTRYTLEGSPDSIVHHVRLGYSHQFTPVDTGSIGYRLAIFTTQDFPNTITNTPTLGWVHRFSPNTVLTLEAGPRFVDDGSVEPEAHVGFEHTFKLAKVGFDFLRTEGVVVGRPGKVEIESVTGFIEATPLKALTVRFEPGWYRTFDGIDPTANVYGFALSGVYQIQRWLAAHLTYRFAHQDQVGATLSHNIVTLGLDASYPIRVSP